MTLADAIIQYVDASIECAIEGSQTGADGCYETPSRETRHRKDESEKAIRQLLTGDKEL